jgi:hypothetical protein
MTYVPLELVGAALRIARHDAYEVAVGPESVGGPSVAAAESEASMPPFTPETEPSAGVVLVSSGIAVAASLVEVVTSGAGLAPSGAAATEPPGLSAPKAPVDALPPSLGAASSALAVAPGASLGAGTPSMGLHESDSNVDAPASRGGPTGRSSIPRMELHPALATDTARRPEMWMTRKPRAFRRSLGTLPQLPLRPQTGSSAEKKFSLPRLPRYCTTARLIFCALD